MEKLKGQSIDFDRFTHLTFDCYGTLIDWESGILAAVRPVLERHGVAPSDERVIELYATFEAAKEAGPFIPYREVLRGVMAGIASDVGFKPEEADLDALPDSVPRWQPFPDTMDSLRALGGRYKLVVLSNIDDAIFSRTADHLGVRFDEVFTSQQIQSYKPSLENFRYALKKLEVPTGRVLHVAQSLYHDHAPAKSLGFTTVLVRRDNRRPGRGVAPAADAAPDMVVPDLASLVRAIGLGDLQSGTIRGER